MNTKPISYPSLKSVLEYMDANLRFRLSHHIPSIRTAERATPLRFDYLEIGKNTIQINEFEYSLRCVQQEPLVVDPTFRAKSARNKRGVPYDLNVYGFQDIYSEEQMAPGDIKIKSDDPEWEYENDEKMKEDFALLEEHRIVDGVMPSEVNQTYLCFRINSFNKLPNEVSTELLTHEKKMPEAMKFLTTKLLGGRRPAIKVYQLLVSMEYGILRLPQNLMLEVTTIEVQKNLHNVFNALEGVVHKKSLPLGCIFVTDLDFVYPENYGHPWVRSSKTVQVLWKDERVSWLDTLLNIENQNVGFECEVHFEDILDVIDHWTTFGKTIGTDFTFEFANEAMLALFFDRLAERPGVIITDDGLLRSLKFPKQFTIRMNSYSELCLFCWDIEGNRGKTYVLEMIVTPTHHRNFWVLPCHKSTFK